MRAPEIIAVMGNAGVLIHTHDGMGRVLTFSHYGDDDWKLFGEAPIDSIVRDGYWEDVDPNNPEHQGLIRKASRLLRGRDLVAEYERKALRDKEIKDERSRVDGVLPGWEGYAPKEPKRVSRALPPAMAKTLKESASGSIHWVTIDGKHIPIGGNTVNESHIRDAASEHNFGTGAVALLHKSHSLGTIKTDEDLYGVMAMAKAHHRSEGKSDFDEVSGKSIATVHGYGSVRGLLDDEEGYPSEHIRETASKIREHLEPTSYTSDRWVTIDGTKIPIRNGVILSSYDFNRIVGMFNIDSRAVEDLKYAWDRGDVGTEEGLIQILAIASAHSKAMSSNVIQPLSVSRALDIGSIKSLLDGTSSGDTSSFTKDMISERMEPSSYVEDAKKKPSPKDGALREIVTQDDAKYPNSKSFVGMANLAMRGYFTHKSIKMMDESTEKVISRGYKDIHARRNNITSEEAESQALEVLRGAMSNSRSAVRFPVEVLGKLKATGGWRTQHVTGKSKGTFAPEFRQQVEADTFGVDYNTDPSTRPVYGYIVDTNDNPEEIGSSYANATAYGDIVAQFKPHVRERTTITLGDSLLKHGHMASSRMDDIKPESIPWPVSHMDHQRFLESLSSVRNLSWRSGFVEAQHHGGLSLSDVEEFIAPVNLHPDHKSVLESLGPKVRYVNFWDPTATTQETQSGTQERPKVEDNA